MTARERKAVARVLREWAAWCEANPYLPWHHILGIGMYPPPLAAASAAVLWCSGRPADYTGPTAATGLLLAAAMVESGDSV